MFSAITRMHTHLKNIIAPLLLQLNVVVSGALDRLHSEKDPCVKYDVNRKIWIYLHRCRTEEEFGKVLTIFPPFSSNVVCSFIC